MKRIVVIGAGPAGLFAAISAASGGAFVVVYEKMPRPASKLLASGGGRCNLTNTLDLSDFSRAFSSGSRFVGHAFRTMSPDKLRNFFNDRGLATVVEDDFNVYPNTNRSQDVLDVILKEIKRLNISIHFSRPVKKLIVEHNKVTGVLAGKETLQADAVIVATGGKARPDLGGSDDGYSLVFDAGHTISALYPALCPLITVETWPASCAGISLPDAQLLILQKEKKNISSSGSIVFTHKGISGPAALNISASVSELLASSSPVNLKLIFDNKLSAQDWQNHLEAQVINRPGTGLLSVAAMKTQKRLASLFCEIAELRGNTPIAQISKCDII